MSNLEQRLPLLLKMQNKHLEQLEGNASDPQKDKGGAATTSIAASLRFIGVAEFRVNSNLDSFRSNLERSAQCRLSLYDRFESGEVIPESYLSMMSFKSLLDALASGSLAVAEKLASVMGGRDGIEEENDTPFVKAFGYMLKSLVLSSNDAVEKLESLKSITALSENKDFEGYSNACEAIINNDSDAFIKSLQSVLNGHKQQSKGNGLFKDDVDEVLCVWGVGLVNLAKSKGLQVQFDDPLIPAALIT